jgi:outer membrane protein OmpA-like peptidoglycan-associated protein
MKAKIALVGLFLYISVCVFAQGSKFGYDTQFAHNKCFDNWFIQFGVGAQTYVGDNDADADFKDRLSVAPAFAVGKWFSPVWGVRLKGQGGSAHGFEDDGLYMQHNRYYNVHIDAMWNLSNYWGVYSPCRVFSVIPYLGLGFAHRFQKDAATALPLSYSENKSSNGTWVRYSNAMSFNPGIQFGFRLSERVNLDFDLGAQIVPDYFDRFVNRAGYEAIAGVTAGLTFKLGKTGFDEVALDYDLIDVLNAKINALRAENEQLAKRPESCQACPEYADPIIIDEFNFVPGAVLFRIGSAVIDANQKIGIYNAAKFIRNLDQKIRITGYADRQTGTGAYNLKLSEQRAKAVAKELTDKYNIPSEKIVIFWKGSEEQPYGENRWNRVVIISSEK